MTKLTLPIRAVLYREGGVWIAHCLEFNIVGDGTTKSDAIASMAHFIRLQVDATVEGSNAANLFRPAKGRYFEMFAKGKDVSKLEMSFDAEELHGLVGDEYSFREFECDTTAA